MSCTLARRSGPAPQQAALSFSLTASHAIPFPHPSLPRGSLKHTAGPPGSGSAARRHRGTQAPLGRARLCLLQREQAGGPGRKGKRGAEKGRREGEKGRGRPGAGVGGGSSWPAGPATRPGAGGPRGAAGGRQRGRPPAKPGGPGRGGTRPGAAPPGPSAERQLLAALHGPRPQSGGVAAGQGPSHGSVPLRGGPQAVSLARRLSAGRLWPRGAAGVGSVSLSALNSPRAAPPPLRGHPLPNSSAGRARGERKKRVGGVKN